MVVVCHPSCAPNKCGASGIVGIGRMADRSFLDVLHVLWHFYGYFLHCLIYGKPDRSIGQVIYPFTSSGQIAPWINVAFC